MSELETGPLRTFATWARTALITEVSARVAAVLAPGSSVRVEQPVAAAGLERAVSAAGAGEVGWAAVAERVAYMWFNRLVALRFMDANGYTGLGVVSPPPGAALGQPEVLAEAKRGVIDPTVVGQRSSALVRALLDGTRPSPEPQGEAYGLLLAEYCRFFHQAMPFMFEAEGDYTEVLMPANLLADDSVLNRAFQVLTPEVCADVEVIGWLYQFYISDRKDEVFAGFKKNQKAGAAEIPAATQLFTPHWIVRYLVENSIGRLWMLNRPSSRLVEQMDYYIPPVDGETDFLKIAGPEELTVIDPACGSGHMLTYAFDLLHAIYTEEGYAPSEIPALILTHNLYGTEIDPRAGSLAAFALAMKARAKQRTFLNKGVQPNICVIEPISFTEDELTYLRTAQGDPDEEDQFWNQFERADMLGAMIEPDIYVTNRLKRRLTGLEDNGDLLQADLIQRAQLVLHQAGFLLPNYAVAVANPPYMGRGNMGKELTDFVDLHYGASRWGLDACFMSRVERLVRASGYSALVTMQSWMYLSVYEELRRVLLQTRSISGLAHLGPGAFDSLSGEVVAVAATVFRHSTSTDTGCYLRLVGEDDPSRAIRTAIHDPRHPGRFERESAAFLTLPRALIAYFADQNIAAFLQGTPIRDFVYAGVGSQTGANSRFVRFWYEVARKDLNLLGRKGVDSAKWTPSTKGGEFRRWYDPTLSVMDWRGQGELIKQASSGAVIRNQTLYFRENLSWTKIGTRIPSFRYGDDRLVHNDASCFLVTRNVAIDCLSAYLNSRTVASLVKELNPTLNLRPSSLLDFPYCELSADLGKACRELSKSDWDSQELSLDFSGSCLTSAESSERLSISVASILTYNLDQTDKLAKSENAIEREAAAALGLVQPVTIPRDEHSLLANPAYRYGPGRSAAEYKRLATKDLIRDLVSYAIGCMFGRYSLDEPGLILADQGATLEDYVAKIPEPSFTPDADNVIPFVDGDWFEDDVVARFRQFLRAAFGEEHFEENLRFVTESLGVKDIRDYFVRSFYKDHVTRYKKRPIYWLFSSPKGFFNALIYMHRYTPSTVSTVLNEYLREFQAKLTASLDNAERADKVKEADRLRKILVELNEYEHDVLYPLATQNIVIDLDDGVKANYPKFGAALKKIPGLEASE